MQQKDEDDGLTEEEHRWQAWVIDQLGRVFCEAPNVVIPPDRMTVAKSISSCIKRLDGGSYSKMARRLGTLRGRVRLWACGYNLPELGTLLKFCKITDASLMNVMTGRIAYEQNSAVALLNNERSAIKIKAPRAWNRLDLDTTQKALEEAIKTEFPPPSLKEVSVRLNRASNTLRYQFPEQCGLLVHRFRKYTKKCKQEFYHTIEHALRTTLKSTATARTLEDLVREFKCHRSVFLSNFPELCKALMKRNKEDRFDELVKIKNLLLFAATEEFPPCSFKGFCHKTGYSDQSLRENFPALCIRISKRYSCYLKEGFKKRREEQERLVRNVAYALHAEGLYPSVRNVQLRIETFSVRSSKVALLILKEVRRKLKLDVMKAVLG